MVWYKVLVWSPQHFLVLAKSWSWFLTTTQVKVQDDMKQKETFFPFNSEDVHPVVKGVRVGACECVQVQRETTVKVFYTT